MERRTTRTASQVISRTSRAHLTRRISTSALAVALALVSQASLADEGGVSFWIPGFFGSLAATPQQPGFSARASIIIPPSRPGPTSPVHARFPLAEFP